MGSDWGDKKVITRLKNWILSFKYREVGRFHTTRRIKHFDDGGFGWVMPATWYTSESGTEVIYQNGRGQRYVDWIPD